MKIENTAQYMEMGETTLKAEVKSLAGEAVRSAGHMWNLFSQAAYAAFIHCNKFSGSPDMLVTVLESIDEADVGTVKQAYLRAMKACTGRTIKQREDGSYEHNRDVEHMQKLAESDTPPLNTLAGQGLKAFKPARAKAKAKGKELAGNDAFGNLASDSIKTAREILKIDEGNKEAAAFLQVLNEWNEKLHKEYDKLSPKKLTKTMAPKEESEVDKRRRELEEELAKLDKAA